MIMEKLRQEKKTISDELLAAKEKLISLEGLNEKLLAQQVKSLSSPKPNKFCIVNFRFMNTNLNDKGKLNFRD